MPREEDSAPDRRGIDISTLPQLPGSEHGSIRTKRERLGLVIAWSREEPSHVGEIVLAPEEGTGLWGRGTGLPTPERRLTLVRWSPSGNGEPKPLRCQRVSRNQLRLSTAWGALMVENIGSCPLIWHGHEVKRAELQVGDSVTLGKDLLLLCVRRAERLPGSMSELVLTRHRFGDVDALGLVGESQAAWELRERLIAMASQPHHVLILGASGTGKELAAQAIHAHSGRRDRTMVSRNAATIPESIADAELFGNARGYPNPGMPDRPGLVGAAHESTLFLDEIGELPLPLQAHLLRVLDQGEYHRLGESRSRTADIRVIAATNRPVKELKHDLIARFALQLELPDLNARREDIPLLIHHLLRAHAERAPAMRGRFFFEAGFARFPRVSLALVEQLLNRTYVTNVRELDCLLVAATLRSSGPQLELDHSALAPISLERPAPTVPTASRTLSFGKSWVSSEDLARLELLRKHRFSPTSCGRDPAYNGNRQTADLHLRHLMCKALAHSDWQARQAVALLAGEDDPVLFMKCLSRIETFISNLEGRVAREPPEQLERALTEDWKGLVAAVLPLVEALRAKQTPRALMDPQRSA